ncbi:hypothetical protein [Paraburkholderia sp. 32]|uniref:hypothetical protein n=1 Tax=Paraburkholderia sp. 32 TaxID=2991057 RepID=UPI003D191E16
MQTPEQRAEFQAAYKAWTELRERHEADLLAIFREEKTLDRQQLLEQAAEVVRAHKRFVDAAVPFVGLGNSLNP